MNKFIAFSLFAVGLLILVSVESKADHCRQIVRVANYGHHKAAIIKKVVVDHHNDYQTIYLPSYYGDQEKQRQEQAAINIELLKALNLLTQRINQIGSPVSPQVPSSPTNNFPAQPGGGVTLSPPVQPGVNAQQSKIAGILQQKCARCHTKGSEKGGVALFDGPNLLTLDCNTAGKVVTATYSGEMPPGNGQKVTDEEFAEILKWFATNLK